MTVINITKEACLDIKSLYICGWKELSKYTGFYWRTLQRWHLERAKLPIIKTHPHSPNSRWVTTPDRVEAWLLALSTQYKKS